MGGDEGNRGEFVKDAEHGEVEEEAAQAGQDIEDEADRHEAAENFVGEEIQVFEGDNDIEFALAVLAGAEFVGELAHSQRAPGGEDDVEEDFEAFARHVADGLLENLAADGEKTAHRVGEFGFADDRAEARGEAADEDAGLRPISGPTALAGVAAADGKFEFRVLLECLQHCGKDGFIVLEVAVHHGEDIGGA